MQFTASWIGPDLVHGVWPFAVSQPGGPAPHGPPVEVGAGIAYPCSMIVRDIFLAAGASIGCAWALLGLAWWCGGRKGLGHVAAVPLATIAYIAGATGAALAGSALVVIAVPVFSGPFPFFGLVVMAGALVALVHGAVLVGLLRGRKILHGERARVTGEVNRAANSFFSGARRVRMSGDPETMLGATARLLALGGVSATVLQAVIDVVA